MEKPLVFKEKYKFIKNIWVKLLCLSILVLGLFKGYNSFNEHKYSEVSVVTALAHPFGEITAQHPFSQQLALGGYDRDILGVSLLLATYSRNNTSSIEIKVTDKSGKLIAEQLVNSHDLSDNSYFNVPFLVPFKNKDTKLMLTITSLDAIHGNAVTVWMDSKDNICYKILITGNPLKLYFVFGLSVVFILLGLTTLFYLPKKEVFFLVTALIFGLIFNLANPLGGTPDEDSHFSHAYSVSKGVLINNLNSTIPNASLIRQLRERDSGNLIFYDEEYKKDMLKRVSFEQTLGDFASTNTSLYSPVNYLPQAIGIDIAKLIYPSKLIMGYMGRLLNLLLFIGLVLLSLKLIPIGKLFLLNVALLPMVMYQASSLSADTINFSLSFLFIAFIIKLFVAEKQVTKVDILYLVILAIGLALGKQSLSVIVVFILILPTILFSNLRTKIIAFLFIIFACGLIYCLWTHAVEKNGLIKAYTEAFNHYFTTFATPQLGILNIIQHPIEFTQLFYNTITKEFFNYYKMLIGVLGWLAIWMDGWTYFLATISLILSLVSVGKFKISIKQRIFSWLIILAFGAVSIVIIYITWGPIGQEIINGVQGRYFIPILPIFIFAIGNSIFIKYAYKIEIIVRMIILFCLYQASLATILFYY